MAMVLGGLSVMWEAFGHVGDGCGAGGYCWGAAGLPCLCGWCLVTLASLLWGSVLCIMCGVMVVGGLRALVVLGLCGIVPLWYVCCWCWWAWGAVGPGGGSLGLNFIAGCFLVGVGFLGHGGPGRGS